MADELRAFADHIQEPTWLEEPVGISMDVSHAVMESKAFTEKVRTHQGDAIAFELQWEGRGETLSDVSRDFYALCGLFAERLMFISQRKPSDHLMFTTVVAGTAHVHLLEFRIVGPKIDHVLAVLWELRAK